MLHNARYEYLQSLFERQKYFKLVCGAGNEEREEVKRLVLIYTLAGAKGLDVSATPTVVEGCVEGIDIAIKLAPSFGINISTRPFIMVSVGMPGDHHVRKSWIDPVTCIQCGLCVPVCPTDAIPFIQIGKEPAFVIESKCIGCGACGAVCPKSSEIIFYTHNEKELLSVLPECIEAGAENIELHAAIDDDGQIMKEWDIVNKVNPNSHNSMCLDRLHLSNFQLEERIKKAKEVSKGRLIIQADGYPMSGGVNDYNTTLQAVAIADVINKSFNKRLNRKTGQSVYKKNTEVNLLLSGGTNALTTKLANEADVKWQGVAIGTYAREIVYDLIKKYPYDDESYYDDIDLIKEGYLKAKSLVYDSIGEINE